jgi:5-(carboxyamino)imidazole ribonucleotide synthase
MSPRPPLPPGSTLGVLGGGQLGRMLAFVARRMGYRIVSWVGGPDTGPAGVADHVIEAPFDSPEGLAAFLGLAEAATVEFENIPRGLLEAVAERIPLMPGAAAVSICQHREREKRFLEDKGIPCARFAVVETAAQLGEALAALPEGGGILKTAEFGYDGKGQVAVNRGSDPEAVWAAFSTPRAVLEERVDLAAELSVLVVRDGGGRALAYDPAENFHRDHILDVSIVPARLDPGILDEARAIALAVAEALDYRGLLAVEFFLSRDGRLLVNEMAPRPHNSGHHTIDACETSQFEQQLRVLCGLAPGGVRLHSPTVMLNLLGDVWEDAEGRPDWPAVVALPGAHLHLYGKHEARRGRKMGHVTFTAPTLGEALAAQSRAREILGIPPLRDSGLPPGHS